MKLSEYVDKQVMDIGPEPWARQVIVKAIRDLGTDENPLVFATLTGKHSRSAARHAQPPGRAQHAACS